MVRYAAEDSVNVTLRDITAKLVTGDSWKSVGCVVNPENSADCDVNPENSAGIVEGQELHLHYGLNNALLEYGTHAVNGVAPNPYFEVDKGIAGIQVEQDYSAHEGDIEYSTVANKIDLKDTNIRNLFTGSTAIVVRNRQEGSQGAFSVAKTVTGSAGDQGQAFVFDVSIAGALGEGQSWNGGAKYTVTDETGAKLQAGTLTFAESNNSWKITEVTSEAGSDPITYFNKDASNKYQLQLKDGQKISVSGVPFGLTVTVTETNDSSSGYITTYTINNGNRNSGTTASGVVKTEVGDPSFHFYNHKDKVADLTLEKLLPEEPESTRKFTFAITLRTSDGGSLLNGTYNCTITDKSGNVSKSEQITNGQLTVNLGHRDKLVIHGLPVGTSYVIRETTAGYKPEVEINGTKVEVANGGTVTGTVTDPSTDTTNSELNTVEYTNTRSGSITITKRSGAGTLLSGAGFTLFSTKEDGTLTKVGTEKFTALAVRCDISNPDNDPNFDRERMRYTKDGQSYVVHATEGNAYFYYRFMTAEEIDQYYYPEKYVGKDNVFAEKDKVEAIVQFTELPLDETYSIQETTVPQGYVQNADFEQEMSGITLPKDNVYDVLYTVVNYKKLTLPTSGLDGIGNMLATGLLLTILAAVLLWIANRRIPGAGPDPKRHSRH